MAKPDVTKSKGRVCRRCNTLKPWESFDKKSDGINGRHSQCKECIGTFKRKWWRKKNTRNPLSFTILEFTKSDITETFVPFETREKSEFEKLLRSMVLDSFCSQKRRS